MSQLDLSAVRDFYDNIDEIWPQDNLWYRYTKEQIQKFLNQHILDRNSYILNAGSAGNTYNLPYNFHHVDISSKHLIGLENFTEASIELLPFIDNYFNGCICVGSVINYCDAVAAISEISRVIKSKSYLILEFENSWGYEYRKAPCYGQSAVLVQVQYKQQEHNQWLFSEAYIKKILKTNNMIILDSYYFHILSAFKLAQNKDEKLSAKYSKYDFALNNLPFIKKHANNILLYCQKL